MCSVCSATNSTFPSKRLIRLSTRSLARRWTAISRPLCPLLSPERLDRRPDGSATTSLLSPRETLPPCQGGQRLTDAVLLDEEADAFAGVGHRVLLRLLDYRAGGDAPQRGHVVKPDFGETVNDSLGAGLHEGDTVLAHCWELFHIGYVALQPPVGERLPAHISAALEAGGKFAAGWGGMVNNRMLRQGQAFQSHDVRLSVGVGRLARRAGEGHVGCRQVVEPEFGHAVKGTLLRIGSERDDVLAQPRELLDQCPVLTQPPVEEERLGQLGAALQIEDQALHSRPPPRHFPALVAAWRTVCRYALLLCCSRRPTLLWKYCTPRPKNLGIRLSGQLHPAMRPASVMILTPRSIIFCTSGWVCWPV